MTWMCVGDHVPRIDGKGQGEVKSRKQRFAPVLSAKRRGGNLLSRPPSALTRHRKHKHGQHTKFVLQPEEEYEGFYASAGRKKSQTGQNGGQHHRGESRLTKFAITTGISCRPRRRGERSQHRRMASPFEGSVSHPIARRWK